MATEIIEDRDWTSKGYEKKVARYDGKCFRCEAPFTKGMNIWHQSGVGAVHAYKCEPVAREAAITVAIPAPAAREMFAKFAGKCAACGAGIRKSEKILYSSAAGARHLACGDSAICPCPCRNPRTCDGWCEGCSSFTSCTHRN